MNKWQVWWRNVGFYVISCKIYESKVTKDLHRGMSLFVGYTHYNIQNDAPHWKFTFKIDSEGEKVLCTY